MTSYVVALAGLAVVVYAMVRLENVDRGLSIERAVWTACTFAGISLIVVAVVVRVRSLRSRLDSVFTGMQLTVGSAAAEATRQSLASEGARAIVQSAPLGLLLIDANFVIAPEHSREANWLLCADELEGRGFLEVLRAMLPAETVERTERYLSQMFSDGVDDQVKNPLVEVAALSLNVHGAPSTRVLSFTFLILDEMRGDDRRLAVSIADVTDRVELVRALKEAEDREDRSAGLLLAAATIAPQALDGFVDVARGVIATMMRSMDRATWHELGELGRREGLVEAAESARTLRDNAALVQLELFERRAAAVEDIVSTLSAKEILEAGDGEAVLAIVGELRVDVAELARLRGRVTSARSVPTASRNGAHAVDAEPGGDGVLGLLSRLVGELAQHGGKEVVLESDSLDLSEVQASTRAAVLDSLEQLIRFAVARGIEEPEERVRNGKPRHGTVLAQRVGSDPARLALLVHDDGRGLDPQMIRRRAIVAGLVSEEEAEHMDDTQALTALFAPGFAESLDRAPGLDVVKQKIVDELAGTITVKSTQGRYTTFTVSVPLGLPVLE